MMTLMHKRESMPQEDLGGMISGTMNFKPEIARLNIQRGYDDTVKVLEPIFKTGVAINRIQLAIESISQEQQRFARENRRFDNQITASGAEIDKNLSSLSKGGTPYESEIQTKLTGQVMKYIQPRLSLDDKECKK